MLLELGQAAVDTLCTPGPARFLDNLGIDLGPDRQELGIVLELHTVVQWEARNTEVSYDCTTNRITMNFLKIKFE